MMHIKKPKSFYISLFFCWTPLDKERSIRTTGQYIIQNSINTLIQKSSFFADILLSWYWHGFFAFFFFWDIVFFIFGCKSIALVCRSNGRCFCFSFVTSVAQNWFLVIFLFLFFVMWMCSIFLNSYCGDHQLIQWWNVGVILI